MAPEPFLTAEWRRLLNITWAVPEGVLLPYLPPGLKLARLRGATHVSFVAFDFRDTRVRGWRVPGHTNFPEINLRFYVLDGDRIGVVFIREFVPAFWTALVARQAYNEPYLAIPMRAAHHYYPQRPHGVRGDLIPRLALHHSFGANWRYGVSAVGYGDPFIPASGTTEHYFKEHEWGFGRKNGATLAYQVEHPRWAIYPKVDYCLAVDFGALYGERWAFLNYSRPDFALLAEGSPVKVFPARSI